MLADLITKNGPRFGTGRPSLPWGAMDYRRPKGFTAPDGSHPIGFHVNGWEGTQYALPGDPVIVTLPRNSRQIRGKFLRGRSRRRCLVSIDGQDHDLLSGLVTLLDKHKEKQFSDTMAKAFATLGDFKP